MYRWLSLRKVTHTVGGKILGQAVPPRSPPVQRQINSTVTILVLSVDLARPLTLIRYTRSAIDLPNPDPAWPLLLLLLEMLMLLLMLPAPFPLVVRDTGPPSVRL